MLTERIIKSEVKWPTSNDLDKGKLLQIKRKNFPEDRRYTNFR